MSNQIIKLLRSTIAGNRPPAAHVYGEAYCNFADMQFGMLNNANVPTDLIAVRFYSTTANYKAGDFAVYGGFIYHAKVNMSAGPFNSANWDALITATGVGAYLPLAGGNMLGPLLLFEAPQQPMEAATKAYVDALAYVPIAGGTMTGALVLGYANPRLILVNTAAPGNADIWAFTSSSAPANCRWIMRFIDSTPEAANNVGSDFQLFACNNSGQANLMAMLITRATGLITLIGDPTAPLGAATKQYVDNTEKNYLPLTGGTVSGNLTVNTNAILFEGLGVQGFNIMGTGDDPMIIQAPNGHNARLRLNNIGVREWMVGTDTTGQLVFYDVSAAANRGWFDLSGNFNISGTIIAPAAHFTGNVQADTTMTVNGQLYGGNIVSGNTISASGNITSNNGTITAPTANINGTCNVQNLAATINITGHYMEINGNAQIDNDLQVNDNLTVNGAVNCNYNLNSYDYLNVYGNGITFPNYYGGGSYMWGWDGYSVRIWISGGDHGYNVISPSTFNGYYDAAYLCNDSNGVMHFLYNGGGLKWQASFGTTLFNTKNLKDADVDALSKINALKVRALDMHTPAWTPSIERTRNFRQPEFIHRNCVLIPEEVNEILPEAFRPKNPNTAGDYDVLDNEVITATLVKAVQELSAQVRDLRAQLAARQ